MLHDLPPQVLFLAHPGHHHGRCHRDQKAWNLGHQGVANRQQNIGISRLTGRETVLQHTNGKATKNIDQENQNAGHCIATHKFGGAVHRAKKVRLFRHFSASALGLFLVDQAGIQVGVHGHLLAWHGVQGKAGGHLGNPLGTLGHHHKVDHHQN